MRIHFKVNLLKPKENLCFQLQTFEKHKRSQCFLVLEPMEPLGAHGNPRGVPGGFTEPCGIPWAPIGAQGSPQGPKGHLGPRGYIDKLPINRPDGGVLVGDNSQQSQEKKNHGKCCLLYTSDAADE